MNKFQAYQKFWESFGIPAYDSNSIPDDAKLPYITYSMLYDFFGPSILSNASVWYRGTKWTDVTQKAVEIAETITRGGIQLEHDDGTIWIRKGTPWGQRMLDPNDDMIHRILLNLELEFLD